MYILLGAALLSSIGMTLVNATKTPGALMRGLIGLGILVVVFGIAYAVSDATVTAEQSALGVTGTGARVIGAGLIMFYVAMIGAVVSLIYSEISKALK